MAGPGLFVITEFVCIRVYLPGTENVDIIQQYVLSTLPGMLAEMQSIVLPMRSLAVTRMQAMKRSVLELHVLFFYRFVYS